MKTIVAFFYRNNNLNLLLICSILLVFYYLLVSPFGLAISPDSTSYLQVSKSLLNGEGFYSKTGEFVKHWPPIYSILIATTAKLTFTNVITAGFILNGITLVVSYIYGFKILKLLKLDLILCYSIPFLMVTSKAFVMIAFMLSESLFLALELITLFYFIKWQKNSNLKSLISFSLLCSLLLITRYAAAGIIGGFLIFELFFGKKNTLQNLKNCFIIVIISIIGISSWLIYVRLKTDATEVRRIGIHILSFNKFIGLFINTALMFIKKSFLVVALYLLFTLGIIINLKQIKNYSKELKTHFSEHQKHLILFTTLSFVYLIFIMISMSFFDKATPPNRRILSLIFPFILFIIAILFHFLKIIKLNKLVYFGLITLGIGILSNSTTIWSNQYKNGQLYSKKEWKNSEIAIYLNKTNLFNSYSNAPDFLNFKTQTIHYYLPFKITRLEKKNTNYNAELKTLKQNLKDSTYIAIYFKSIKRTSTTPKAILKDELKEFPITYFKDGFIIGHIKQE
jgi:hypothetical protein